MNKANYNLQASNQAKSCFYYYYRTTQTLLQGFHL